MTQKDYKVLAEAIANARPTPEDPHEESSELIDEAAMNVWKYTIQCLCERLKQQNASFSSSMFKRACGLIE